MGVRKPLSKKIRFEIFKRDSFTCQYCGQKAPEIILQVDHIDPVATGGNNNILNLITSCFDCNNGKGVNKLDDNTVVKKQRDQLELLQERKEQIEMMLEWHKGLADVKALLKDALKEFWEDLAPGYSITEHGVKTINKLLREYTYEEIKEAMEISADQYLKFSGEVVTDDSWQIGFNKIAGIARVRRDSIDIPDLKDLLYIRGILKNRLRGYFESGLAMNLLKKARECGVPLIEINGLALKANYMDDFETEINQLIEKQKIDDLPF